MSQSYEQKFIYFKDFLELNTSKSTWFYEYEEGLGFRKDGFLYFVEISNILSELTHSKGILWSSEILSFFPLYFNRKWHFYIHANYKGDGAHNQDVDDNVYFDLSRKEYLEEEEFKVLYKKYVTPLNEYKLSRDIIRAHSRNPNVKYYPFGEEPSSF